MNQVTINIVNGKYRINGKPIEECNAEEKEFFRGFILAMKWQKENLELDHKTKKQLLMYKETKTDWNIVIKIALAAFFIGISVGVFTLGIILNS